MNKLAITILLSAALLGAGCSKKAAPLPVGAVNSTDATINATLQSAHAAVAQYENDIHTGVHVPTSAEKVVVNKIIDSLNVADPAYQAYHAVLVTNPSAPEPANLAAAINDVLAAATALQNSLGGK